MDTRLPPDGAVPLVHLGVIGALGADAAGFLQGQLTNDVAGMAPSQVRLAGFCSAKGRLQASFIVWKAGAEQLLMVCAASVLPATLKRLSMFVLRARCKLRDASAEAPLWGLVGATAAGLMGDLAVWHRSESNGMTLLRLPDVDGQARCIVVAPAPELSVAWPSMPLDAWRRLEVRSGIALIETATVEQFVPQMLNYELVGGVDFQKGCYPGQEVVARSQYRGTIKRRMFLFDVGAIAAAGQEVFHSADPGQPAGMVVNAAPDASGKGSILLAEVKLAALDDGTLHLASPAGASLTPRALPYAVPQEAKAA